MTLRRDPTCPFLLKKFLIMVHESMLQIKPGKRASAEQLVTGLRALQHEALSSLVPMRPRFNRANTTSPSVPQLKPTPTASQQKSEELGRAEYDAGDNKFLVGVAFADSPKLPPDYEEQTEPVQVTRIAEYIEERQTRDEYMWRTQRFTIHQNPVGFGMGARGVLAKGAVTSLDKDELRKQSSRELADWQAALAAQMAAIAEVQRERAGGA